MMTKREEVAYVVGGIASFVGLSLAAIAIEIIRRVDQSIKSVSGGIR